MFWLCWVFVAACRLSSYSKWGLLLAEELGGLILVPLLWSRNCRLLALWLWPVGLIVRGIFPEQGSNPCPLRW